MIKDARSPRAPAFVGRGPAPILNARAAPGEDTNMEIKCLEIRDQNTFLPVICIRPVPDNEAQRYLMRRDGYRGDETEHCIIMVDAQCRGVAYDPYDWVNRWPTTTSSSTGPSYGTAKWPMSSSSSARQPHQRSAKG
jgi:hypothetical protein